VHHNILKYKNHEFVLPLSVS